MNFTKIHKIYLLYIIYIQLLILFDFLSSLIDAFFLHCDFLVFWVVQIL